MLCVCVDFTHQRPWLRKAALERKDLPQSVQFTTESVEAFGPDFDRGGLGGTGAGAGAGAGNGSGIDGLARIRALFG